MKLGSYENVKKGDKVMAVGSPLGLSNTVSDEIISGIRSDAEGKLIQITAPISEGSGGGALFDADYNVIGVTYDEGENLKFANPIWRTCIIQCNRASQALMSCICTITLWNNT